ncbi:MAG: DUF2219 family protein, partial [Chitinophagaceae bacterium]
MVPKNPPMRNNWILIFLLVALLYYPLAGSAQEKTARYGFIIDQDLLGETFGLKNSNEDRNYTMGLGLFATRSKWAEAKLFRPLEYLSNALSFGLAEKWFDADRADRMQSVTLNLGMTGFTPRYLGDNITDSLYYMVQDRPFASLLFLSVKYQTSSRQKVHTSQIVFGMMGLKVAQEVQSHIHEKHWLGSTREIPYGWKYQVGQGGKFTMLYSDRADVLLSAGSYKNSRKRELNTQFIASREYRIGYYTDVSAGMAMRLGLLDPDNWAAFDTYQLSHASSKKSMEAAPVKQERKLSGELFLWASVKPHVYLYNQFLQSRDTELDYDFKVKPLVVDAQVGVGLTIPNAQKNFAANLLVY